MMGDIATTYLKTAILFITTPTSHISSPSELLEPDPEPRVTMSSVSGMRGSSILFSCTWNEKRKKDREDVNMASRSRRAVGGISAVAGADLTPAPLDLEDDLDADIELNPSELVLMVGMLEGVVDAEVV
jgi:hypothetical protein